MVWVFLKGEMLSGGITENLMREVEKNLIKK
jgi:hypothetical protein